MVPERTVRSVARSRWRAMGSDAEVIVVGGPSDALIHARGRVEQLEQRWSRFRPDSEVSRLNARAGHVCEVSEDTVMLVRTAVAAWRESGGSVNPTVLGDVVRAGYDTSLERLRYRCEAPASSLRLVACTDIAVDGATVTLPAGTGFDPGGIGKGLAADLLTAELRALGAAGACVNLGGDVRVSGCGPTGEAWTIAVEDPSGEHLLTTVGLADGAVATSTTTRRRWSIGERSLHHLIDPATGEPSATDLVQATVLAAHGWLAETYAKAVLLRGAARAFDVLPPGVAALTMAEDGTLAWTDALTAHVDSARSILPSRALSER